MHSVSEAPAAIEFGRFRILPRQRTLLADNRSVELGGRAFDLLMALIEARGAVVSKQALMESVWPGRIVEANNLMIQMSVLRRALGADRRLIRTFAGKGYQFIAEVRAVSELPDEPSSQPVSPLSHPPTNLPESLSELIGRDAELGKILGLIGSHSLVTLVGAGGIGKTRLGFEVARELLPKFADGIWAVELAPLSDDDLVPVTVATALGIALTSGNASPRSVASALGTKQLLLVLDNCEHVLDAAARMAEALLRENPAARVIATSREPLRAEGEWVYRVPPLAVPPDNDWDGEDPLRFGAVRLFDERARESGADLPSDARAMAALVGICRRLDGIPLAIELAASRAAALGIDGLAARLEDRFRLLTNGRRTAPRHQTLRAALDWSHTLLTEPERLVLRRLAIFAGSFSLAATREVVTDQEIAATEVDDCLASLVAKSLVTPVVGDMVRRHRLLETTRAYALEKLVEAGEFDAVARRHARRYLDIFERAEIEVETRPTDQWLADYAPRLDNVRVALDWAFSSSGDATIGVALTNAAVPLWMHLSLIEECRGRVERALAGIAAGAGTDQSGELHLHAALATSLLYTRGAVAEIGDIETRALQIAENLDDTRYQLRSLWGLWSFHITSGQQAIALGMAQRFRALAAKQSDPFDCLIGERMIGTSKYYLGDFLSARHYLEHVLDHHVAPVRKSRLFRFEVDHWTAARIYLARILWLLGSPDQAMCAAESSLADARATNHAIPVGQALALAVCPIALFRGDLAAAEHYVEILRDHSTRHGLARWNAFGRIYQAELIIQRGDIDAGLPLLRASFDAPAAARFAPRFFAFLLASALGRAGQISEALATADSALVRSESTEERRAVAELLRVKGELTRLRDAAGAPAAAEDNLRRALGIAHQQGALSLELRAATSLARLWRDQARSKEANALLAEVYDRFTEGFGTADLRAARSLLDELT